MSALVENQFGDVTQVKLGESLEALVIKHQYCQAKVSVYGGHVLSWQPNEQHDVFWLSNSTALQEGKAIRGGIPLCWPWFGPHPHDVDNIAGNHGFAREKNWLLDSVVIEEHQVRVTLSLQGENLHSMWSNAFKLTQVLTFGKEFSQTLTMVNLSDADAYYSAALHSYFAVSSPEKVTIDSLDDARFYNKLTDQNCVAEMLKNGVGPVDRVYHSSNDINIIDSEWQRTIHVSASNTAHWVFWNPGVEVAANMADVHNGGEQEYICLEAANTDLRLLAKGSEITIAQQISITPCE